jgi:hypothetical protein
MERSKTHNDMHHKPVFSQKGDRDYKADRSTNRFGHCSSAVSFIDVLVRPTYGR